MKDIPLTKNEKQELMKKSNNCGLARNMGIEIIDLDYGYAKSRLTVGEKHLNVLGILHGATVLCLADHTAVTARMIFGGEVVALQISANLTEASIGVEETIYCEARLVEEDQQIVYKEITVYSEKGDLIAKVTMAGIKPLKL